MCGKVKNWNEFQHFKDRSPPWIKLYKYLLDDPEWHSLSGDDAKHLVMLWLIASEDKTMEGRLPDARRIAFRLRISESDTIQLLNKLSNWLMLDDINLISERYQHVIPEERRGETETETDSSSESVDSSPPNCPIQEIIEAYHAELPTLPRVRVMTSARETQIRQRWREDKKRQSLDWWKKFFAYVERSDFLTGRENPNGRNWMADLEWLTKAGNFAKVIEGKYHAQ